MANLSIPLKNKIINIDNTATIYELQIPIGAELTSNDDLIELGVGVQEYGVVIVPADASADDEVVGLTSGGKDYTCAVTSITGGTVGGNLTFAEVV